MQWNILTTQRRHSHHENLMDVAVWWRGQALKNVIDMAPELDAKVGGIYTTSLWNLITNCLVEVLTKVFASLSIATVVFIPPSHWQWKKSGICGSFGCVPTLRYGAGAKKNQPVSKCIEMVARRSGKLTLSALLVCEECQKSSLFPWGRRSWLSQDSFGSADAAQRLAAWRSKELDMKINADNF